MKRGIKLAAVPLAAVLVVGLGAAGGVMLSRDGVAARVESDVRADATSPAPTVLPVQFYAFDPPLTVNIKDTDAVLQAGVSVSTRDPKVLDALKRDDPALRSAMILAFGDASEAADMTDAGKQQLLGAIAGAVNRQLAADGYRARVDAAYFTDFIVQGGSDDQ
ncbi:flagellar basal body-associated FliL family protein [Sphingomonas sp. RHCKR7]|uniref:flagellar basal body-associated FliL family protein n=1 Tax=Sphingomonas folli TaxID=2862497 RepID=UPI001C684166|nr:flagellar basal body-associated FliL family protein [Sphingomonas folli]MBW6525844.1 flagellar basal body-associated FliL family protein [Sphingomonas folli]